MFFGAFFGLIAAVAIYHLLMYAVLRVPEFFVVQHPISSRWRRFS